MADWVKIRADYVSGGVSYSELSERHGVPLGSIKRHAAQEGWAAKRTETEPNRYQKTVRKVIERKAEHEADRITRLLGVGDLLADKLEQSAKQLGAYTILKRKSEHVIEDDNGDRRLVEDTEEIAVPCESIISTADAKRLASALKDLNDVAKVADTGNDASLSKARELLEGLPSAID